MDSFDNDGLVRLTCVCVFVFVYVCFACVRVCFVCKELNVNFSAFFSVQNDNPKILVVLSNGSLNYDHQR